MTVAEAVESRARLSRGVSNRAIYHAVARALRERGARGELLVDVGCGSGNLWHYTRRYCRRYLGVDVVRYEGFPPDADFKKLDLDTGRVPLPNGRADVVAAVETIEHLENPRAFMRELVRLTKPGGWVVVTTPNQLSLLSKMTLLLKNQFNAFQKGSYPAHLTALLEVDLRRIAAECGLTEVGIRFSRQGRLAGTAWHYPGLVSRLFPRACSDNVLMIARRPHG